MLTVDMEGTDLSALEHRARTKALLRIAREAAAGGDDAMATVRSLVSSEDAWERWLAAPALGILKDDTTLLSHLQDPSRSVRQRAMEVLTREGSTAAVATALDADRHLRRSPELAAAILQRTPAPAVERLVVRLAEPGHPRWLDRLPACSAEVVRAHLARLDEHGGASAWRRLARNHPELLRDHFVDRLGRSPQADSRLRWRIDITMGTLVQRAPDAALDVIDALFDQSAPPEPMEDWIERLARLRPARTFDLLRARQLRGVSAPRPGLFGMVAFPDPVPLGLERICWLVANSPWTLPDGSDGRAWVRRLSEADRAAFCVAWRDTGAGAWGGFMFGELPASDPRREVAFRRWVAAASDAEGRISITRLEALPRDLREQEARRHLHALPWLQARPLERRVYARLLGFEEAESVLTPWLTHPEGTERAAALSILLSTPRFDVEAVNRALAAVRRRKNEQDPVRNAMLAALAGLPPSRLHLHLDTVAAIVEEALDAADLSTGTAHQAQRLAAVLVAQAPEQGVALVARILRVRGSVDGAMIGKRLLPADAARLDPVLAGVLADWTRNERADAVVGLLNGLGARLRHMPATLAAIDTLCAIPSLGVLASLLDVLAAWAPKQFGARALAIFAADPSTAALPAIARHLATCATDRLDPLLDGRPMTGRWATGRTHWVLDFGLDFSRWTATQQARYARALDALLDDPDRDVPTCRWALERRSALTWAPAASLLRLTADPRPPVREIAIRAAPHLDDGSGLDALVACLDDDRARIAIYALRVTLAELRPQEVLTRLSAVSMARVTVAKEVLRLMGEFGGPGARDALIAIGRKPNHRDVRIALLRALWTHIEHPEAWALLEAAATDPDVALARGLLSIPLERLSSAADPRLCALFAQILARPEVESRLGFLDDLGPAPLRDQGRVLLHALVHHLGTPDPTEAARTLRVVLQRMHLEEVPRVVARIAGLLPNRPHAAALLDTLCAVTTSWASPPVRGLAEALLGPVTADRLAAVWAIRLSPRVRDSAAFVSLLETLETRGHLHHDAVAAAFDAVRTVAFPDLVALRLQVHPSPRLRRIALAALVCAARPENGWTPERRALLLHFRADPEVEVAAPAAWVNPPPAANT